MIGRYTKGRSPKQLLPVVFILYFCFHSYYKFDDEDEEDSRVVHNEACRGAPDYGLASKSRDDRDSYHGDATNYADRAAYFILFPLFFFYRSKVAPLHASELMVDFSGSEGRASRAGIECGVITALIQFFLFFCTWKVVSTIFSVTQFHRRGGEQCKVPPINNKKQPVDRPQVNN